MQIINFKNKEGRVGHLNYQLNGGRRFEIRTDDIINLYGGE